MIVNLSKNGRSEAQRAKQVVFAFFNKFLYWNIKYFFNSLFSKIEKIKNLNKNDLSHKMLEEMLKILINSITFI